MAATPVEESWQDGDGGVANCPCRQVSQFRLWLFFAVTQHKQPSYTVYIHAALGVVGPGGGLSMLLSPCLNGEMPAESSLTGGNSDGNIQLRPDDGGFCTALDFKFCDFFLFLVRTIQPYSY